MASAAATQGLASSIRNLAGRLTKTGMLPVAEKQAVTKAILGNTIPSAVMVTGFNMLGGVDPMTSLLAGAVDLGIGYGGMKLKMKSIGVNYNLIDQLTMFRKKSCMILILKVKL